MCLCEREFGFCVFFFVVTIEICLQTYFFHFCLGFEIENAKTNSNNIVVAIAFMHTAYDYEEGTLHFNIHVPNKKPN